jgi:hypothetical protein
MEDLKIRGRRAYLRKQGTTLPDNHPDAWNTVEVPDEARGSSRLVGRGVLGGRVVLYFDDGQGRRWASLLVGRAWDEGVGAPSNYDAEQVRARG